MGLYMPALSPLDDMSTDLETRRRRLLFRACHRGTKEADLMVGGFVTRHIPTMSEAEMDALEAVLEFPDVDLADWLSGRRPVPPECRSPMLDRMATECTRPGAGLAEDAQSR